MTHSETIPLNTPAGAAGLKISPPAVILFFDPLASTSRSSHGLRCPSHLLFSICRQAIYGPLIKRCPVEQTQQIQEPVSEQKNKESK
jgi:hypothetical protein